MKAGEKGGGGVDESVNGRVEGNTSDDKQGNGAEGVVEGNATSDDMQSKGRNERVEGVAAGGVVIGGDGEMNGQRIDDGAEGDTAAADRIASEVAGVNLFDTAVSSEEQFSADFQNGLHQVAQDVEELPDDGDAESDLLTLGFSEQAAEQDWVFHLSDGENSIVLSADEQDDDDRGSPSDMVDLESSSEAEIEVCCMIASK